MSDNGDGKNLQKPHAGGRRPRLSDPRAVRKLFTFVRLVYVEGMALNQAFKATYPYTKAKRSTWSGMGRELLTCWEKNYQDEIVTAAEAAGVGKVSLLDGIREKRRALMLKDVYEERTKTYVMADGTEVKEPISVRVTAEVEDNAIQLKTMELQAKVLGIGIEKKSDGGRQTVNLMNNPQFLTLIDTLGAITPETQKEMGELFGWNGNGDKSD